MTGLPTTAARPDAPPAGSLEAYRKQVLQCLHDNLADDAAWQALAGGVWGGAKGARDGAELGAMFDGVGAVPGAVIGGLGGAAAGAIKGGGLGVLDTTGRCLVMPNGLKGFR